MSRAITLDTIRDAARAVYAAALRTPLVPLDLPAGEASDLQVYLKLENLQSIGSFKIRGAYNAVRQLPPALRRQGVWTVSAGNAAQGVALAARLLDAPCSVMVMDTAPETKLRALARLGATIVKAPYDECWETVERHGSSRMRGVFVHPFDDDGFISGNGTIALELVEDLPEFDAVVAPLGGGGLVAGLAAGLAALRPAVRVYAAEPETAAPLAYSLAAGAPGTVPNWRASFVDGAGGRSVLPTMWPLLATPLAGSIVVGLEEIGAAIRLVAERARVIAEGAAGCAVAAAVSGRAGGGRVVAIVSGGNIDLNTFAAVTRACAA